MPKPKAIPLSGSDFESFEYSVVFENTTAKTALYDSGLVRVIELMEKGVVLRIGGAKCAQGHMLLLHFFPGRREARFAGRPRGKDLAGAIDVTGKVASIAPGENGELVATVELYQPGPDWARFLQAFEALQEKVDRVSRMIKE